MQLVGMNIQTIAYIKSENEFNRARKKGFWQTLFGLVTGRASRLRSFDEVVVKLQSRQSTNLGLHDISLQNIVGSVGREQDFTHCFLPRKGGVAGKERWRRIYTLAVTGEGFPPIEVYKIGEDYFVEDGHHRVSVARYLAWDTIQANILELSAPTSDQNSSNDQFDLGNGAKLCMQA